MNFPNAEDLYCKTIERKYAKEIELIYDKINFAYLNDSFYCLIDIHKLDIENINLSEILKYLELKKYKTEYDSFKIYIDWSHDE